MKFNKVGWCLVGAILLAGCSSNNDAESEQAVFREEVPEAVSSISIVIQDLDGNPLSGIPVTIDDNDTGLLAKLTNRPVAAKGLYAKTTDLVSDDLGVIEFELVEGTTTGDLTVTVNDGSYFPVTQIYSLEGESQLDSLTLTARPAAGETESVVAVTETGEEKEVITIVAEQAFEEESVEVVDDEGNAVVVQGQVSRIQSDTEVTEEGEKEVVAEVLVPVAVVPTTSSGVEAVGAITVTAAVYQNDSEESIAAFPGGLGVGDDVDNLDEAPELISDDGTASEDDATFVSAGFISLEVTDADGNDITEFSGSTGVDIDGDGTEEEGLLVTSLIPKTTINPESGELLALGDTVPVWSYDDQTAKWEFDGNAKIFESADDENWRARFAATHLSYWNLDWRATRCAGYTTDATAPLEFLSAFTGQRDTRQLKVTMTRAGNGYFNTRYVYGDGFVSGRLGDDDAYISVIDADTGEPIDILSINGDVYTGQATNFCDLVGAGGNDIVLDEPPVEVTLADMTVIVETSCSDESLDDLQPPTPVASSRVYAYNAATGRLISSGVTDSTGTVSVTGVNADAQYYFYVRNRLYPSAGDSYYIRTANLPVTDVQPLVVDIEQECVVTTGSTGGN
ncbi:hypothetical protein EOL70_17000 [Leucothrix sargassi]|nr:hypothetical protein EOL70_17000 [Leucothrix sargassi]